MAFESSGYRLHDLDGKLLEENIPPFTDLPHFENLASAIRDGATLNAEIADAQKSALMCHLGNIAYRSQSEVRLDPGTHQVVNTPATGKFWRREYRKGWEPKS